MMWQLRWSTIKMGNNSPESGRDRSSKVGVFGLRSLSENKYCTILRLRVDSNLKMCVCAIKELHAIVYVVIYYDFRIALWRLSVWKWLNMQTPALVGLRFLVELCISCCMRSSQTRRMREEEIESHDRASHGACSIAFITHPIKVNAGEESEREMTNAWKRALGYHVTFCEMCR